MIGFFIIGHFLGKGAFLFTSLYAHYISLNFNVDIWLTHLPFASQRSLWIDPNIKIQEGSYF